MSHDPRPIGVLNIDKPTGLTSHDVISHLRRLTGIRRIGHAGTLDPLATGVLLVCVGLATRLSEYLMAGDKTYRATLALGIETDTWDADGEIVAHGDVSGITPQAFDAAASRFIGMIDQVPPVYSAIKRHGKPAHRLVRGGQRVELEPRRVTISAIERVDWDPPQVTIDVTCGKGTYIRSLAHDLGVALGCAAHLAALRRTRSGHFSAAQAVPLSELQPDNWRAWLIAPWQALEDYARVCVSAEQAAELRYGRPIEVAGLTGELGFAFDDERRLLGVLVPADEPDWWRPTKVLVGD